MTTTPPPPGPPPEGTPAPAPSPVAAPTVAPEERVRLAYMDRARSDYVFDGLGMNIVLLIITCGIWGYYVLYQLMRRMRDHNRRRLELLEGATELAWNRASAQGVAEELRPNFERVSGHLATLRAMTGDFRDPAVWLIIAIVSGGIGTIVAFVFLDQDLVKHDYNEGAIEAELSHIYGRLGEPLPAPDPGRQKGQHNYAGRIVATIFSCGIYSFWWYYDLMLEPNRHFAHNWPWEDALANAVQRMTGQPAA